MRILLIDSDSQMRQSLLSLLTCRGDEVQVVDDGREALPAVDRYDPDWILTDLYNSGMDGLETILALRRSRSRARIVAMAKDSMPCAAQCLQFARVFGAEAVLVKPFEAEQLFDILGGA